MCAGALADALLELANGMRLCQHLRYALYLSVNHASFLYQVSRISSIPTLSMDR